MGVQAACTLALLCGAVAYGVKSRVEIGPLILCAGFVCGAAFFGLDLSTLLSFVPVKVLFYVVSVTLFYGIAQDNGTLERLSEQVLYAMRRVPKLIPLAIFATTAFIACMGVGIFAGAFIAPLAFGIAAKVGAHPLLVYACVNCGAIAGSNAPQSLGGIVVQGFIAQGPYADQAWNFTAVGSLLTAVVCSSGILLAYLAFGRGRMRSCDPSRPMPLDARQKKSLALIIAVCLAALFGPLCKSFAPETAAGALALLFDIGVLCTAGTCVASVLGLTDIRAVIRKRVPWSVVILLSGVSIVLGVLGGAYSAEEMVAQLSFVPREAVAPVLVVIAGTLSLFASGVTVVCPLLFPFVPALSTAFSIPPAVLYAGVFTGASVTGSSPFSTSGSVVFSSIGGASDEEPDERLIYQTLAIPLGLMALAVVAVVVLVQAA